METIEKCCVEIEVNPHTEEVSFNNSPPRNMNLPMIGVIPLKVDTEPTVPAAVAKPKPEILGRKVKKFNVAGPSTSNRQAAHDTIDMQTNDAPHSSRPEYIGLYAIIVCVWFGIGGLVYFYIKYLF